ncbi:TOBE domain-containing protein, partial [Klebsiella aerogenes]
DYVVPVSRDVLAKAPNETKLTLGIRPEAFTLASEGIGLDVAVVEELGADAYLYGSLVGSGKQASIEDGEAHQVVARISSRRPPQRGEQVRLGVDPASVHVFSQETTERIS